MREYRWLLMDADNTLFDFNAAEEFALTRTLLHYGISPTEEAKAGYHAINNALWAASDQGKITQQALMNERFVRFFEARGIQGNSAEWNQFFLEQLSQCSVLLPGAEALCRKLSQKYILALCTNSAAPFVARRRLENSPLARFFGDRVFISGEMGCHKPEKAYFDKVLETLGATKHKADVLVIGGQSLQRHPGGLQFPAGQRVASLAHRQGRSCLPHLSGGQSGPAGGTAGK